MSKNYDQIATVTIDLQTPLIDDASFDKLCIIGPAPKTAPEKAPPAVGVYGSMDEVTEAGWDAFGEDRDPVALAALTAFSQSPVPGSLYIAPMQLSKKAVESGKAIKDAEEIISANFVKHGDPVGCRAAYSSKRRLCVLALSGPVTGVSNVGITEMMKAAKEKGYTIEVEGKEITGAAGLLLTEVGKKLKALQKGGEDIEFVFHLKNEAGADVPYGVLVQYPNEVPSSAPDAEAAEFSQDLGDPAAELESPVLTAQRAVATAGWYVLCTAGVDSSLYPDIASYIETQEKLFCYTELGFFSSLDLEGNPQSTVEPVYMRTIGVYGRETSDQPDDEIPEMNPFINVAFAVKWLNYESGSETAAFKPLQLVYPADLSTMEAKQLADASLNYFITVGNRNITMNGKVIGGEWADVIRFRDWLKNDMQVRVVNLFVTRPKIPFTDPGIALVQNQMIASLEAGRTAGGILPDEYDADGNVIPGYTTSVPLASSLTAAERASRKLTRCTFSARLAGAIHFAELKGTLGYESV